MERGLMINGKWYPHRQSQRKSTHDYASTASYMITQVARQREPFFLTPELRTVIEQVWHALPERFPNVTLDEFVIMPDHLHFIIHIQANEQRTTLSTIMQAFKSLVCYYWLQAINATGPDGIRYTVLIWQRYFDDVIIYTPQALQSAREYIRNNPTKAQQEKWNGF